MATAYSLDEDAVMADAAHGAPMQKAAAAIAFVFFVGSGIYLVRLGRRTWRTREFRNQRPGELIVGAPARCHGAFLFALGACGIALGVVAVCSIVYWTMR